jgi:hypothetical protein
MYAEWPVLLSGGGNMQVPNLDVRLVGSSVGAPICGTTIRFPIKLFAMPPETT